MPSDTDHAMAAALQRMANTLDQLLVEQRRIAEAIEEMLVVDIDEDEDEGFHPQET